MNQITHGKGSYSAWISLNGNNIIGITYILIRAGGGYLRRGGNNCTGKKSAAEATLSLLTAPGFVAVNQPVC